MIDQKKSMDPQINDLSFMKSEVDFELPWRCISKIRRTTYMATYTKEIENLNNKIVYINSIVETRMILINSLPLGLVTGDLSGTPWSTL